MRIGIDGLAARMGGGTVYLRNQLAALTDNAPDWHFVLFCVPQNMVNISVQADNVETVVVDWASRSLVNRVLWQQVTFPIELRKRHVDLLYCPGNFCLFWAPCPQVLTLQNLNHFASLKYQRKVSLKVKRLLQGIGSVQSIKRADFTVFISHDYRRNVEHYMSLHGVDWEVVYSGVDMYFFGAQQQANEAMITVPPNYILAVSNFHRHKNYETLFRAFELISSRHGDDLRLMVAGAPSDKTYFKEMEYLLSRLQAREKIHLLGSVERGALPTLYTGARCYASTSILEAFPLTPFEAMTTGTPIVISQTTVFPEICGEAAIYFDPMNPKDVASKIELVLDNKSLAKNLVQKGFKQVKEYSWDKNAQRLIDIFKRVAQL